LWEAPGRSAHHPARRCAARRGLAARPYLDESHPVMLPSVTALAKLIWVVLAALLILTYLASQTVMSGPG
jgi:hypothetical protein